MRKDRHTSTFEVVGMLQMSIRALESNPKGKSELEKNAIEMVKESVKILSEDILDRLSEGFHTA